MNSKKTVRIKLNTYNHLKACAEESSSFSTAMFRALDGVIDLPRGKTVTTDHLVEAVKKLIAKADMFEELVVLVKECMVMIDDNNDYGNEKDERDTMVEYISRVIQKAKELTS